MTSPANPFTGRLLPAPRTGGYQDPEYWIWCGSAAKDVDGTYHLFASRWPRRFGFGWQWCFNSEVVRCESATPEGPYRFAEVVLPRRDRSFFDGLNTHNPSLRCHGGRWYLYYFGSTYDGPIPTSAEDISQSRADATWLKKRIGLAVADSPRGPWCRRDTPLLEPRPGHWDATITSNPSAAILPDGTTYLMYKSNTGIGATLQLGIAVGPTPEGPFERLQEDPIFNFPNPDWHVEDPFFWWADGRFHILMKDDFKNDCGGITGHWGGGVYATSEDAKTWTIHAGAAYTREITWDDGSTETLANRERPFLLFDAEGRPSHLFQAVARGPRPWAFENTWCQVTPLAPITIPD